MLNMFTEDQVKEEDMVGINDYNPQLAFVLGHKMSHNLLDHHREGLSLILVLYTVQER